MGLALGLALLRAECPSLARYRIDRLPAAVMASRAATTAAWRRLIFDVEAVAKQRGGTRDWVIVVVDPRTIAADAILLRVRNVVSERCWERVRPLNVRRDGASVARGPSDRGKLSEVQFGIGATYVDGAPTPGGNVGDLVVLEH